MNINSSINYNGITFNLQLLYLYWCHNNVTFIVIINFIIIIGIYFMIETVKSTL
jgi:hypothetical protein